VGSTALDVARAAKRKRIVSYLYVRGALTGYISVDLDRNQRHSLDVLSQQWSDEKRRPELSEGFTELLHDPDPRLRAAAVQFFVSHMAEDGGALLDAYENRLQEFEGVPRHWYPGDGDLRDLLVLAISKRMLPGSRALELMKREALRPGHGGYATVGILATDPLWLRQHIVEIVSGSLDALPGILFHPGVLGVKPDELLLELKGRVAEDILLKAIHAAPPKDRERLRAVIASASESSTEEASGGSAEGGGGCLNPSTQDSP